MTDLLHHPDEELSALLDGELTEQAAAEVNAHVVACSDCSAELAAVRLARASVRSLPAVEPPAGFIEGLLAGHLPDDEDGAEPATVLPFRSRRAVLGHAAAAVAAGLLLVVSTGGDPATAVAPEVNGVVERHASSIAAVPVGLGATVGARPTPSAATRVGDPYLAPDELAGYRLVDVFPAADGLHLLYRKGPYGLSVFQQRGEVDFDRLPDGGDQLEIDGGPAWGWQGRVLVVERGDLAVTLVGDESGEVLEAAASGLPGGPGRSSPSWSNRLKRACGDALDMLSPTG